MHFCLNAVVALDECLSTICYLAHFQHSIDQRSLGTAIIEPEEEEQDNQNVVTRTSPLAEYMYEEANDTTMIIKNARASSSQTMIHHAAAPLFKDE